jgi:hypothetical protein
MEKDSRKKLMEMMEKVNPGSVNPTPNEKEIIDDILSLDEGVSDILSKMKEYARKGLLTATVILSVASAVAAGDAGGNNISADDVINSGIEMVDNEEDKKMYGFYAALASEFSSQAKRTGNMEANKAFGDIAEYFVQLKEGKNPAPLEKNTYKYMKYIREKMENLNPQQIQSYIIKGRSMEYKPVK